MMRQDAFFETHQVHMRELQSFRTVQGHQFDPLLGLIILLVRLRKLVIQRGLFQEFGQRRGVCLIDIQRHRVHDLIERLDPGQLLIWLFVLLVDLGLVVNFAQQSLDDIRHPPGLGLQSFAVSPQQPAEFLQRIRDPRADLTRGCRIGNHFP